jgi:glycerol-3-phosphate acyltransferase PlsY
MIWGLPAAALIGYLFGSIPVGLIITRINKGVDIRDYGSGVTGATNVIRTSGAKAGVLTIIGDVAKGIAPVYIGLALAKAADISPHDDRAWVAATSGTAAVIGHIWPLFAGFRGGKAVATGFGAALAMNPLAAAAMIPVAALVVASTRIMSMMSITMAPALAVLFIVLAALDISPPAYAVYAVIGATLIVWRHNGNIRRLLAGEEPKIGQGGTKRADAQTATR